MHGGETEGIKEQRRAIRHLLRSDDPSDALASYYALWHDPRRTRLSVHYDRASGLADGFIAVAQTGANLFQPVVTLRARSNSVIADLLQAGLRSHRAYQLIIPVQFAPVLREQMELSQSAIHYVLRLRASHFEPVINVLVQRTTGPDELPRFKIESQGELMALSGCNWRSPSFAEVFVYVHPRAQGRGWGRSVVSACTADLLEQRFQPLYLVDGDNHNSLRMAGSLGYVDTGARELAAEGRVK